MNDTLRLELEGMYALDQEIRKSAMEIAKQHGMRSPEYQAIRVRGQAMDEKHIRRLEEIIREHGWPGRSLVGESACNGAFMILQHADLDVQRRYLDMIRVATERGEIAPSQLPLLEDRVLMEEGKPQVYGTQLTRGQDGKPTLWPIQDEEHVDERRARAGLEPLSKYLERWGIRRAKDE